MSKVAEGKFYAEVSRQALMIGEQGPVRARTQTATGSPAPIDELASPIAFTTTANEIRDTCAASCHRFWIATKSQLDPVTVGRVDAHNPRTGVICRIGTLKADPPHLADGFGINVNYFVELEINERILVFKWSSIPDYANFERNKKCAHESFIKLCAFAGIRAGYGLTINPETY
jgi:hypothetical protein